MDDDRQDDLSRVRLAFIAAGADHRMREDLTVGDAHTEALGFAGFEMFAHDVWRADGPADPLWVTQIEDLSASIQSLYFADSAAAARWAIPGADRLGVPREGALAGTTGPVGYIDVKHEGLCRLVALHEIAHLLCDTIDTTMGHGEEWSIAYRRLIATHLGEAYLERWQHALERSAYNALRQIEADPDWLAELINP